MKIVLTQQAYKKFMFGVMNCDKEIGYMGRVIFDKKSCTYTVTNVYLPTQEVTGSTTDLDADSVAKCEIASINEKGYYNAWLHSHVHMGAFWSGTDTSTIKEMGLKGLCVAIVGNKKREMKGAVYVHSEEDHVPDIFNDNVPVSIEEEVNEDPWVMASHIEWIEKTSDIGTLCNIDDISDMEKILTGVRSSISSAGSLGLKSLSLLRVVIMLADPDETMDIVMMMKWIEK